jgi:hypothetical protein
VCEITSAVCGTFAADALRSPASSGGTELRGANMDHKKNYKVVYTIVERRRDKKKFWLRIGAAFTNQDGSLNVHLDATPVNGQLQIRDYQPYPERGGDSRDDGDDLARALAS